MIIYRRIQNFEDDIEVECDGNKSKDYMTVPFWG
jgi:hypothetical protein